MTTSAASLIQNFHLFWFFWSWYIFFIATSHLVCLSISLFISLSLLLSVFLSVFLPISLCLSPFVSLSLSIYLSLSLTHMIIWIFSISYSLSLSLYLFSSLHYFLRISDRGHSERRMRRASDSKIHPKHNGNFESDDESDNDEPVHRQMNRRKVRTSIRFEDHHDLLIHSTLIELKFTSPHLSSPLDEISLSKIFSC